MTFALDTETTGLDLYHGAKPFFVTVCHDDGRQVWYEWDVDPRTREPQIPKADLRELKELLGQVATWSKDFDIEIAARHQIITQNGKFDVAALETIGITNWPWQQTHDTLIASHILASNQPHDLTSLTLTYLLHDLKPLEDDMRKACMKARGIARRKYPDWQIAKKGLPSMPSAKGDPKKTLRGGEKDSPWKFDCWLPRAMVKHWWETSDAFKRWQDNPQAPYRPVKPVGKKKSVSDGWEFRPPSLGGEHPWWTVTARYANGDSEATMALWPVFESELKKRDLWEIYLERNKLSKITHDMQALGVSIHAGRTDELEREFREHSDNCAGTMKNIALSAGYALDLPKGNSSNKSLTTFVFDCLKLPATATSKKTGNASLSKAAIELYEATLPPRSKQLCFMRQLKAKRKIDTHIGYLQGYKRFWVPLEGKDGWFVLHPNLNPCGTDTLRWSSNNPNSQNISKQEEFNLRYCLGPAPGREWWSMDAKNLELRIPAYVAGEEEMIALFEKPDEPPYYGSNHLLNFHTVYPDIWEYELGEVGIEKVGPTCKKKYAATWYQRCKNGGFAVQYGAIDRTDQAGTADRAFGRIGCHTKLKERFKAIHGPGGLNERCIKFAEKHGYVETLPRRSVNPRHGYPLLVTRTERGMILPTVPLNYVIQGSAMDWTSGGMARTTEYLETVNRQKKLVGRAGFFLTMQVHDELVFDFPSGTGEKPWQTNLDIAQTCRRLMEQGGEDIGVPTPCGLEYHSTTYAEGVSV